jgi:hypothetical protein
MGTEHQSPTQAQAQTKEEADLRVETRAIYDGIAAVDWRRETAELSERLCMLSGLYEVSRESTSKQGGAVHAITVEKATGTPSWLGGLMVHISTLMAFKQKVAPGWTYTAFECSGKDGNLWSVQLELESDSVWCIHRDLQCVMVMALMKVMYPWLREPHEQAPSQEPQPEQSSWPHWAHGKGFVPTVNESAPVSEEAWRALASQQASDWERVQGSAVQVPPVSSEPRPTPQAIPEGTALLPKLWPLLRIAARLGTFLRSRGDR